MRTIAFFNNKGGVGKTTLVYHLAWMYAEMGKSVLAVDLDPQANVTSMFVEEGTLEGIFESSDTTGTIYRAFQPQLDGTGDVSHVTVRRITPKLALVAGDLALSAAEDELSSNWPDCLDKKQRAFRVLSAMWRILEAAGNEVDAEIILIDVGPNLGALNRAALICADDVVVPLAPDLYSLQGLRNLGPTLKRWRGEWVDRLAKADPSWGLSLPRGLMRPLGYVVLQHTTRADRPVRAYSRWMSRIPSTYAEYILGRPSGVRVSVGDDPNCLATLKNYRSLMPLSQEAHKPMFLLRPADGALGGHAQAVSDCYDDFRRLALTIESRQRVSMHTASTM